MPCPLCGKDLVVRRDPVYVGDWCSCRSCHFAGYPFDLAVARWGVPPAEAATRLRKLGVRPIVTTEVLSSYNSYQDSQQRWQEAWDAGRAGLSAEEAKIYREFRRGMDLGCEISDERWSRGVGSFFGLLSRETVEQTISVQSGKTRRLPRRAAWSHVLAVPFYDLPGRLSDLWVAHQSAREEQQAYLSLHSSRRGKGGQGGLAFLQSLENNLPRWRRCVIACRDTRLALQLHARQAAFGDAYLPVVSWVNHDGAVTQAAWSLLAGRHIIFLERRWDWETAKVAASLNADYIEASGWIDSHETTIHGRVQETALPLAAKKHPEEALMSLRREKKPWYEAAAKYLPSAPVSTAKDFLSGLTPSQREAVLAELDPKRRDRLERSIHEVFPDRVFRDGSWLIQERPTGWYRVRAKPKSNEEPILLSDAIVRVTRIWVPPVDRYEGEVLFRGKTYSFSTAGDLFRRSPDRWLEAFLIAKKAGQVYLRRPLRPDLWSISHRFCSPEICEEKGVGWNPGDQELGLAGWTQAIGQAPSRRAKRLPSVLASDHISFPRSPRAADFALLSSDTPENNFLWGALLLWSSQLLRPVFGLPSEATFLSGPNAGIIAEKLSLAMGLPVSVDKKRPAAQPAPTLWLGKPHTWRSLVLAHSSVVIPPVLARVWSGNGWGSWLFSDIELDPADEQMAAVRRLFGWLLGWVIEQRGAIGSRGPLVFRLIKALRRYSQQTFDLPLPASIRTGLRAAYWPTDTAASWVEVMLWLRAEGFLRFPCDLPGPRGIAVAPEGLPPGSYLFQAASVENALYRAQLPAIRGPHWNLHLYRCGLSFHPDRLVAAPRGWVVSSEVWESLPGSLMSAVTEWVDAKAWVLKKVPKHMNYRGFVSHPIGDGSVISREERPRSF